MSEVTLKILGRPYTIACEDGQQEHITKLGSMIENKLSGMAQLSPQRSQNLLFAALFLADDLVEAQGKAASTSDVASELEALRGSQDEAQKAKNDLELERDALLSERDILRSDLSNAQSKLAETNAQLKQMSLAPAPADNSSEFAPKLENLAAALEKCAAELERKTLTN